MRNDSEGGDMKQLTDEISCGKQKPSLNLSFQESIHNPLMTFSSDRSSSLFNKREILLLSTQRSVPAFNVFYPNSILM